LIARALEIEGIPTVIPAWRGGILKRLNAPRYTTNNLQRGMTLGKPFDSAQQLRIISETLAMLNYPATGIPKQLQESV